MSEIDLDAWEREAKISYSDSFIEPIDLAGRRNAERILKLIEIIRKKDEQLEIAKEALKIYSICYEGQNPDSEISVGFGARQALAKIEEIEKVQS